MQSSYISHKNVQQLSHILECLGFDTLPCGEVLRITGLIDHSDRVTYNDLKETNLRGTLVLFTQHFQYCKAEERPTPELMTALCKAI